MKDLHGFAEPTIGSLARMLQASARVLFFFLVLFMKLAQSYISLEPAAEALAP